MGLRFAYREGMGSDLDREVRDLFAIAPERMRQLRTKESKQIMVVPICSNHSNQVYSLDDGECLGHVRVYNGLFCIFFFISVFVSSL